MSLRATLMAAVARCTPLEMQHATSTEIRATSDATGMQQSSANPHEYWVNGATGGATTTQQGHFPDATGDSELQVAFPRACNTQPSSLSGHRVTAACMLAAMEICDLYGDSDEKREEMRADIQAVPWAQQHDLLEHLEQEVRQLRSAIAYGEVVT